MDLPVRGARDLPGRRAWWWRRYRTRRMDLTRTNHARKYARQSDRHCQMSHFAFFSFEVEDASVLARTPDSVNTYTAIDTGLRAMANIRRWESKTSYHSPTKG